MRFLNRKPRIIKIRELTPYDEPVIDVADFNELIDNFKELYETERAFYGRNEDGIFRFRKANFKPKIRKVQAVTYDPAESMVFLSVEGLMELACDYEGQVLETDQAFLIMTPGIVFIAEKKKEV